MVFNRSQLTKLYSGVCRFLAFALLTIHYTAQAEVTSATIEQGITANLNRILVLSEIKKYAERQGFRVWLTSESALALASYTKWHQLTLQGVYPWSARRYQYDFFEIFRTTDQMFLVTDGNNNQVVQLESYLERNYHGLFSSTHPWNIRAQNAKPNVTSSAENILVELTGSQQINGQASTDIAQDTSHFVQIERLETLPQAQPLKLLVQYLYITFKFGLRIPPTDLTRITAFIARLDTNQIKTSPELITIEEAFIQVIQNALNAPELFEFFQSSGLKEKILKFSREPLMAETFPGHLRFWFEKSFVVKSFPLGTLNNSGVTPDPAHIIPPLFSHDVRGSSRDSYKIFESITANPSGQPNLLTTTSSAYMSEGLKGVTSETGRFSVFVQMHPVPGAVWGRDVIDSNNGARSPLMMNAAAFRVAKPEDNINLRPLEILNLVRSKENFKEPETAKYFPDRYEIRGVYLEQLRRKMITQTGALMAEEIDAALEIFNTAGQLAQIDQDFFYDFWFSLPISATPKSTLYYFQKSIHIYHRDDYKKQLPIAAKQFTVQQTQELLALLDHINDESRSEPIKRALFQHGSPWVRSTVETQALSSGSTEQLINLLNLYTEQPINSVLLQNMTIAFQHLSQALKSKPESYRYTMSDKLLKACRFIVMNTNVNPGASFTIFNNLLKTYNTLKKARNDTRYDLLKALLILNSGQQQATSILNRDLEQILQKTNFQFQENYEMSLLSLVQVYDPQIIKRLIELLKARSHDNFMRAVDTLGRLGALAPSSEQIRIRQLLTEVKREGYPVGRMRIQREGSYSARDRLHKQAFHEAMATITARYAIHGGCAELLQQKLAEKFYPRRRPEPKNRADEVDDMMLDLSN